MYEHMISSPPSTGAINQGAIIGRVGNTGDVFPKPHNNSRCTTPTNCQAPSYCPTAGTHLHFEVRVGNPANANAYWALAAHNPITYLTNAPTFDAHGAFRIQNVSNNNRYLNRTNNSNGSTLTAQNSNTSNNAQNWIITRLPTPGSNTNQSQFQLWGFDPVGTHDVGRVTGTSTANNVPTITTGTTNTTIVVEPNFADGTVRFRLGTASNALTLGISGNTVQWQTNSASSNAQKWVLEPHTLNDSRGDVDSSSAIDFADSNWIMQFLPGTRQFTPTQRFVADVDRNGVIDAADANALNRWFVSLDNCYARTCSSTCTNCYK